MISFQVNAARHNGRHCHNIPLLVPYNTLKTFFKQFKYLQQTYSPLLYFHYHAWGSSIGVPFQAAINLHFISNIIYFCHRHAII